MMDEYSRSWSGFGGLHRNKKRKKKVWPALYGRAGLAKRRCVISITDAGEIPVHASPRKRPSAIKAISLRARIGLSTLKLRAEIFTGPAMLGRTNWEM
jgi:hypothetical protein